MQQPFLKFLAFSIFLTFLDGSEDVGTEPRQRILQSYLQRLKAIQQYYELLVIRRLASDEMVTHLGKTIIFTYHFSSGSKLYCLIGVNYHVPYYNMVFYFKCLLATRLSAVHITALRMLLGSKNTKQQQQQMYFDKF